MILKKNNKRVLEAKRRAPKHPPGPEAKLRLVLTRLFMAYHKRIIKVTLSHAKRNDAQHLALQAGLTNARAHGHRLTQDTRMHGYNLTKQSQLRSAVQKTATQTADNLVSQLQETLNQPDLDPDLRLIESDYLERIVNGVDTRMDLSIERAQDILDEWEELDPETSPRAGDSGALALMLSVGLDGVLGGMLGEAGLAFGYLFGQMNQATQEDAGVEKYVWRSQHDSRVREEHADLDGQECNWDDPPLSGEESSSGEDCHPGEDYNCRCVAAPIESTESIEQSEGESEAA